MSETNVVNLFGGNRISDEVATNFEYLNDLALESSTGSAADTSAAQEVASPVPEAVAPTPIEVLGYAEELADRIGWLRHAA